MNEGREDEKGRLLLDGDKEKMKEKVIKHIVWKQTPVPWTGGSVLWG